MTSALIRGEKTQRSRPCEPRSRLEQYLHEPRNAWSHQKLEEVRTDPPREPSEGAHCQHLDFRPLCLQNSERINLLFIKCEVTGYGSLEKPSHGGLRGGERYREPGAVLLSLETGWRGEGGSQGSYSIKYTNAKECQVRNVWPPSPAHPRNSRDLLI